MRRPATGWLALGAALLVLGGSASAEEVEPINTDRPDISEASVVVGRGVFQLETGVLSQYRKQGRGNERAWITPTLLRFGLDRRWEARLETDGFTWQRTSAPGQGIRRTSGYSPLAPGFKYHIQDPKEGSSRPSLGAIVHVNVPTGSSDFRSERVTGDAKLAADFDLGGRWGLGTNLGAGFDEDDNGKVHAFGLATASLGYQVTPRLRVFGELAFQGGEEARGGGALLFDTGVTYLVNTDTQLDVAVARGISGRTTPDYYWTVGFSRRFR